VNPSDLTGRLIQLGYFPIAVNPDGTAAAPTVPGEVDVADAIKRYVKFHGLPTPEPAAVLRHMEMPRCGLPDYPVRAPASGLCKWPHKEIRFWCGIVLSGFSADQIHALYRAAVDSWGNVCDIRPTLTFDSVGRSRANVVSTAGVIDGVGSVLGYSYLPCGSIDSTQLTQLYDSREPWTTYGSQFLQEVIAHEIGHALGLDHLAAGNLMAPVASGKTVVPQAGDIREVIARYGKMVPVPTPEPTPNPTPTPGDGPILRLAGLDGATYEVYRRA
jgi:hypothetical protein